MGLLAQVATATRRGEIDSMRFWGACLQRMFLGRGGQGLFAMVISWIVLAIGQLSVVGLPLIEAGSGFSQSATSAASPGEPSTLFEAMIGVSLIAVYLVFARRFRSRRSVSGGSKPAAVGRDRKAA